MMCLTNAEKGVICMAGKKLEDTKQAKNYWTATKGKIEEQEKVVSIDGMGNM